MSLWRHLEVRCLIGYIMLDDRLTAWVYITYMYELYEDGYY